MHSELQELGGRLQFVSKLDARFAVHYQISRIVISLKFPKWKYKGEAVLTEATREGVLEFYPAQSRILPFNVLCLPDDRRATFSYSSPNKPDLFKARPDYRVTNKCQ
jgi:hypothetical protein